MEVDKENEVVLVMLVGVGYYIRAYVVLERLK